MSYNKEELAKKAQEHYEDMDATYMDEIQYSIDNSIIYRNNVGLNKKDDQHTSLFSDNVIKATTTGSIFKVDGKNICALNFASYKHPGGGFMNGSMAQEEALCHDSTLYNVLSNTKFKYEYYYNQKHLNEGLYENWAIYSPGIVFEKGDGNKKCSIITCPSPNWNAAEKNGVLLQDNNKAMDERIKFVLDIATKNNVDTLILGAFGCGVFKQNLEYVLSRFKYHLLNEYHFDQVYFAIPEENKVKMAKKILFKFNLNE